MATHYCWWQPETRRVITTWDGAKTIYIMVIFFHINWWVYRISGCHQTVWNQTPDFGRKIFLSSLVFSNQVTTWLQWTAGKNGSNVMGGLVKAKRVDFFRISVRGGFFRFKMLIFQGFFWGQFDPRIQVVKLQCIFVSPMLNPYLGKIFGSLFPIKFPITVI